ncbi:MAG: glycosyltransferase family 39 protein [Elusimicrobiales bacterium]
MNDNQSRMGAWLAFLGRHWLAAIFLLALALRLLFLLQWRQTPYYPFPVVDAWVHQQWARDILSGHFIRDKAFYQSPFYPYLLAGVFKIFGANQIYMLLIQAFISAASAVIIALAALRCFGKKAGVTAGIMCAVYVPFIMYSAVLLKETWVIFSFSLLSLLALRVLDTGRGVFLCGLCGGWAALSRGNILPALAVIPAFWLLRGPVLKPAKTIALFFLGIALPVLPATLHNYIASRDFVLINYTGGFVFYIGNNGTAIGAMDYPDGISSAPLLEEAQSSAAACQESGRLLKPSEISSFWFRKGLRFIKEHPLDWLKLTARKTYIYFNHFEPPDMYNLAFVAENFRTLLGWPLPGFLFACSAGLLGICLLWDWNRRSAMLAALAVLYSASVIATSVMERYRLPALVFLLIFAGGALARLTEAGFWRNIPGRRLAAALPLLILLWLPPFLNPRPVEAQSWSQLSVIYAVQHKDDLSLDALRRAFDADPARVTAEAVINGALISDRLGYKTQARSIYDAGIKFYPDNADLYLDKGALLFEIGEREEAVSLMETAARLDPQSETARKNLFLAYAAMGDKKRALRNGLEAVRLSPGNTELKAAVERLRKTGLPDK